MRLIVENTHSACFVQENLKKNSNIFKCLEIYFGEPVFGVFCLSCNGKIKNKMLFKMEFCTVPTKWSGKYKPYASQYDTGPSDFGKF